MCVRELEHCVLACVCVCVSLSLGVGFVLVYRVFSLMEVYHQYGRYWYKGMACVPYMRNTNMHGKISAKTERLVVNGCYYHPLFGRFSF